ncbi:MAG: 3-hydroxy-3-methylglutaryl-CoA reductase [Gammaproteobacteria bacterium]|nr:MAG: 3-hydroxy-3-methylglutaryl-CoA reductase [Gammaproteobacteria bacterium]
MNTTEALNTKAVPIVAAGNDEAALKAARRWSHLACPEIRDELFNGKARRQATVYQNNIESYIGTINIPVGLAGPLQIHGAAGTTEYRVPLATTEAALVASYNRGARLLTAAGGCTARVVAKGVSRTPVFAFDNLIEATRFAAFIAGQHDQLHDIVGGITSHGKLLSAKPTIEGNKVYLDLCFSTGDASGQNMVTFASDAICKLILEHAPVQPRYWFLEANFSGDKKASAKSMADVRGKRVVAEVTIPRELVESQLHTTPEHMVDYWYAAAIGGVMSGTTGIHGHIANGIAALYLACGQDIACVAESAVGITRVETTAAGDLYASVTLPNIMVGTVGGGTGLPSAKACLDILGLAGKGKSSALAEVCGAIVLAGELSIIGAFCSGDFASAHRSLSRGEPMQGRN